MKNEKQTVGEFFQEVRKEKNISVDEIVRDTNIPKRYLESIEADNFDIFPGETYAMGFISNYADALEIDRDAVLNLYHRQMKIEQDSPIEELVGRKKDFTVPNNVVIGGVVALGALLVIILVIFLMTQRGDNSSSSAPLPPRTFIYSFDAINKIQNQKYRVGDTINLTNESRNLLVNFAATSPSRSLTVKINQSEYTIKTGEQFTVDSDSNGTNDLKIELFSAKENDVRLSITPIRDDLAVSGSQDNLFDKYKEFILSETVLMQTNAKSAVSMKITASGSGWVRYVTDNGTEKETVLNAGAAIVIPFIENATLYLGNSGAFKINIAGHDEDGGGWGEVSKSIFYWKNKDNKVQLVRAVLK